MNTPTQYAKRTAAAILACGILGLAADRASGQFSIGSEWLVAEGEHFDAYVTYDTPWADDTPGATLKIIEIRDKETGEVFMEIDGSDEDDGYHHTLFALEILDKAEGDRGGIGGWSIWPWNWGQGGSDSGGFWTGRDGTDDIELLGHLGGAGFPGSDALALLGTLGSLDLGGSGFNITSGPLGEQQLGYDYENPNDWGIVTPPGRRQPPSDGDDKEDDDKGDYPPR